jgi:hypothetical protein
VGHLGFRILTKNPTAHDLSEPVGSVHGINLVAKLERLLNTGIPDRWRLLNTPMVVKGKGELSGTTRRC